MKHKLNFAVFYQRDSLLEQKILAIFKSQEIFWLLKYSLHIFRAKKKKFQKLLDCLITKCFLTSYSREQLLQKIHVDMYRICFRAL